MHPVRQPTSSLGQSASTQPQEEGQGEAWRSWTLEEENRRSWEIGDAQNLYDAPGKFAIRLFYTQDLLQECVKNETDENEKIFFKTVLKNITHVTEEDQGQIQAIQDLAKDRLIKIQQKNQKKREEAACLEQSFGEMGRLLSILQKDDQSQSPNKFGAEVIASINTGNNITMQAINEHVKSNNTRTKLNNIQSESRSEPLEKQDIANHVFTNTSESLSKQLNEELDEYQNLEDNFLYQKLRAFPAILNSYAYAKIRTNANETDAQLDPAVRNWIKQRKEMSQQQLKIASIYLNSKRVDCQRSFCLKIAEKRIVENIRIDDLQRLAKTKDAEEIIADKKIVLNREKRLNQSEMESIKYIQTGQVDPDNFHKAVKHKINILKSDLEVQLLEEFYKNRTGHRTA